jgi:hypothetical protein
MPVLRLAADDAAPAPAGSPSWPQPGCPADAQDGATGDLPEAQHQRAASRASGVSLSAARPGDRAPKPGLVFRHHVHSDEAGLFVSGGDHGLAQPPGAVVAPVQHHGCGVLHASIGGGVGPACQARNLQHRPGQPIHQPVVYSGADGRGHPDQHGWPRSLDGQCFHRAAMAVAEVRVRLPACVRDGPRAACRAAAVDRPLQPRIGTPICLYD